jgi:hypothetical protein
MDTEAPSHAAHAVTALYQAHALGLVRLAVMSKGNKRLIHDFFEFGVFGAGQFKRLAFPLAALNPSAGTIAW